MKKIEISNRIINIFYIVFILLFLYLITNVIFFNNTAISKVGIFELVVGIIIYFMCTVFLYKLYNKCEKHRKLFTIIFGVVFVIVQFLFSYLFSVSPTWDFGSVYDAVVSSFEPGITIMNEYLYKYNNNIGIAFMLKIVFSFFMMIGMKSSYLLCVGIIFNICMIDISLFYLYKILSMLFKKELSRFFIVCALFVTPFITYCPIFYTDTLSMPFSIVAIYYFSKFFVEDDRKFRYLGFCGILLGIGICIKFTVSITLIAMMIFVFFTNDKIKEKVFSSFLIILIAIIPYFSLNIIESKCMDSELLNIRKVPLTHWIMMGLRENKSGANGEFSYEDLRFTEGFKTIDEKKENNIKVIKKRITEYIHKHKLMDFYTKKAVFVWGDGTFYAPEKLRRSPIVFSKLKNMILGNGKQTKVYHIICQTQIVLLLLFIVLALIFRKKLNEKQQKLLLLTSTIIFGNLIFFSIWESRSRYLVNFIPVFLIQVFLGVFVTYLYLKEVYNRKTSK